MKKKKVLFISSTGGHFNELMQLRPMFEKYDYHIITEKDKFTEKLKKQYGTGIDVIVGDAIYLNEKVIKAVKKEKYIGVFRLKENNRKIKINRKSCRIFRKIKKSKKTKIKK